MIDIMPDDKEIFKALNVLNSISDKLRYEKVKDKNSKLRHLPNINYSVEEGTDIVVSGLGFIRITKEGSIKIYTLDEKMISKRKSMI